MTTLPSTSAPAFKEWYAVVQALAHGEQTLILRKGGIAEGRGGFTVQSQRFWLYPTWFHAQQEGLRPEAHMWLPQTSEAPDTIPLEAWAEVTAHHHITDEATAFRLCDHHFWTEQTVRDRFHWSRTPGLHVLVIRVHRLHKAIRFAPTTAQGGCKSWVEIPHDFTAQPSSPVLETHDFENRYNLISNLL